MPRPLTLPTEGLERVMQRSHRPTLAYSQSRNLSGASVDQSVGVAQSPVGEVWLSMPQVAEKTGHKTARAAYRFCQRHGLLHHIGRAVRAGASAIDAYVRRHGSSVSLSTPTSREGARRGHHRK
jgi:hypothetical protein